MPQSTISLEAVYDALAAKGVPDPRSLPSGYSDTLTLELGDQVMADLLGGAVNLRGEVTRFNWKFNRAVAASFQLNSWQQDYPQLEQPGGIIGWGEECDICDINNTQIPKPLNWDGAISWKRQLPRTSLSRWRPTQICWMYNEDLAFGAWPGRNVVYSPLIGANAIANPIMNMLDKNENLLILTTFGTTGATEPFAPPDAAEGTAVPDGTVMWTVVSRTSQGFRVDWLPSATSPNYLLIPYYQIEPPKFENIGQMLDPIPDSFSRHFYDGLEAMMFKASPNPGDKERGERARADWMQALLVMTGQGNKEQDAFSLVPINQAVERRWQNDAPYTADHPV